MREVQIVKWCDICYVDAAKDDALFVSKQPATEAYTVACIEGEGMKPTPKVLDLCEVHAKPYRELALLLKDAGQLPAPAKVTPAPAAKITGPPTVTCPVCQHRIAKNSLLMHIWGVHAKTERPPVPKNCPECREPYQSQGMTLHRKAAHGIDPLNEALGAVTGYKITGKEREQLAASEG